MKGKKSKADGVKLTPIEPTKTKGQEASDKAKAEREARKAEEARQRAEAKAEQDKAKEEARMVREAERKEAKAAKAAAKQEAKEERERIAAERKAQREATRPCFCGCGTEVTGVFAMGHDGRVHGWYVRATREKKPEPMPPEASDEAIAGLELWSKDKSLRMKDVAALVRAQAATQE